jgi:hypothetical protein
LAYFSRKIGKKRLIDETSLSNGELYTILTNKAAKGKRIYSSNDCWHQKESVIAVINKR